MPSSTLASNLKHKVSHDEQIHVIHKLTPSSSKERVEEDLFVKANDKKYFDMMHDAKEEEQRVQEETKLEPLIKEAELILKSHNSQASQNVLAALARWKLGL